jgi:hypothetical protein
MEPKTIVTSNWLKLPRTVIKTPFQRSAFSKIKTLPAYSPILFGVNTLTVIPVSTAPNALKKGTVSIFRIRYFHFIVSILQLTNIKQITTIKVIESVLSYACFRYT